MVSMTITKENANEFKRQTVFKIELDDMEIGEATVLIIPKDVAISFSKTDEYSLMDELASLYQIEGAEAQGLAEFICDQQDIASDILYIQCINLGFFRGQGFGKEVLLQIEEKYKECIFVLFAEPIPSSMRECMNNSQIHEVRKKLKKFYLENDYREIYKQVFVKNKRV